MRTAILAVATLVLAVPVGIAPPYATPGGDKWIAAQQADQVVIVNEMNADLTSNDGQLHPAGCFAIYQLSGHMDIASVSIRRHAKVSQCGTAKDFGVYVLRKSKGHWAGIATATGLPGGSCQYNGKVPAKVVALLAKVGPCYTQQG